MQTCWMSLLLSLVLSLVTVVVAHVITVVPVLASITPLACLTPPISGLAGALKWCRVPRAWAPRLVARAAVHINSLSRAERLRHMARARSGKFLFRIVERLLPGPMIVGWLRWGWLAEWRFSNSFPFRLRSVVPATIPGFLRVPQSRVVRVRRILGSEGTNIKDTRNAIAARCWPAHHCFRCSPVLVGEGRGLLVHRNMTSRFAFRGPDPSYRFSLFLGQGRLFFLRRCHGISGSSFLKFPFNFTKTFQQGICRGLLLSQPTHTRRQMTAQSEPTTQLH